MKKTVFLAALQLVVAAALHPAFAVEALTVQGAICDTKGAALKGQQTIECRLYSQGEGGEALWGAAIATLLDTKGVFTIELRDDAGSKIVDSQLGDVLKKTESGELWLGVAVNGGGEMKPRQEIVSVPFAIVGLDSSSAVDFSVSGTARVDRVEVADPEHTDGNFNAVTTDGVLFQRSFTVEGDAAVSGGASISGNLEVGNDVEVGKISAAEGFFGAGAVPVGAIMPWWGLEDPETGELVLVDTSDRRVRTAFADRAAQDEEALLRFLSRSGIDHISLSTDRPYVNEVRALFKRRARKR